MVPRLFMSPPFWPAGRPQHVLIPVVEDDECVVWVRRGDECYAHCNALLGKERGESPARFLGLMARVAIGRCSYKGC